MTDIITNPEPIAPTTQNPEPAVVAPSIDQAPMQPVQPPEVIPSPGLQESPGVIVPAPNLGQSAQAPETASAPEESLTVKYEHLAAEFRSLTQKKYETGLNPEEMARMRELDEMAGYGLFVKGQIESLLQKKQKLYLDHRNVESQELSDPQKLAEEYRDLNRKTLNSGLNPEDLQRWMHLRALAGSGAFENLDKAA